MQQKSDYMNMLSSVAQIMGTRLYYYPVGSWDHQNPRRKYGWWGFSWVKCRFSSNK